MFLRYSKRSCSDTNPVDGIDDLPGDIITEILNHLPTKDAVATSILSHKWRHRWKQVTTFDVEGKNIMECVRKGLPQLNSESIRKYRIGRDSIVRFVRGEDWDEADIIPYFPVCKVLGALKVLDLGCFRCDQIRLFALPHAIYSCKTLEVMKLEGIFALDMDSPWEFEVCLPRLAELELNWVEYGCEENICKLISNSPVLRSLTIKRRFSCDWNLTVSSLSLKRLHICFELCKYDPNVIRKLRIDATDAGAIKNLVLHDSASNDISITGFSSVDEADLDLFNYKSPSMIVVVLEALHGAKFLKLSRDTMMALAVATRALFASFERLVKLSVEYDQFSEWNQWKVVELIDRCVNLQVLEIKGSTNGTRGISGMGILRRNPKCLSGLKQVTFNQVTRFDLIMKLILNHGLMMETCNLWFGATTCEARDKMLQMVFMNKASPTCKISTRI